MPKISDKRGNLHASSKSFSEKHIAFSMGASVALSP